MAKIRGGDKAAVVLGELGKKLAAADVVRIGFLEGATYPNGLPVAMIAAINEFGRPPVQPPRPFMRRTIAKHSSEWPVSIASLLKTNDYDAEKTLAQIGAAIAGQIREGIIELVNPPLAPSTIARKHHTKPLIDSGHLLQSVDFEVKTR